MHKECEEKVCGLYSIRDIDLLRLRIKNHTNRLSRSQIFDLKNRYNSDMVDKEKVYLKVRQLLSFDRVLRRVKEQYIKGFCVCLSRKEIQSLVEKVVRLVGIKLNVDSYDYEIDSSKEEEWVFKYPFCRTYEDWEKWSKFFCGKLNLQVNAEQEVATNLMLEISRNIVTPNVLLAISAHREVKNNINLEINRSDEEIKLDFELMIEKVPSFDLNLDVYSEIVKNHKLSFDMVKTIYNEGLSLQVNSEEVQLKTPVNAYTLEQLSGDIDPTYLEKFGAKTTINKKDLLQDYK